MQTLTAPSLAAVARRGLLATCVAVALLEGCASYGPPEHALAGDAATGNVRSPPPLTVDPGTMSCRELKSRLNAAGELILLAGPGGGFGDTFYGPAVPRCQFWQMPQFTYVKTRDGLCGVGYICVQKYSVD